MSVRISSIDCDMRRETSDLNISVSLMLDVHNMFTV